MKFSEVSPTDEELKLLLEAGFVLRETGRFEDAATVFRGVAEFLPGSVVPQVALGTVYLQQGLFSSAEAELVSALRSHPESSYARFHYAEALLFQQRHEEAIAELKSLCNQDLDSPGQRAAHALLQIAELVCPNNDSKADGTNFARAHS